MRLSPVKRRTTERNLERCYPDISPEQRDLMVRDSFQHYLCSVLETGHNWNWTTDKLASRCIGIVNERMFRQARATGKGLLTIAPHFGAWEYLGVYLQRFDDIAILYKPPSNPRLEEALLDKRRRGGAKLIPANNIGLIQIYEHLRAGKVVGVLPDQQPPDGKGEFVPFFGNQALTSDVVPRLIKRTESLVLATVCERLPGGRYQVHLLPPDEGIYSDDLMTAMTAMNRTIERCVAIDPVQYLWSYRRFKAQPEGARPFYELR